MTDLSHLEYECPLMLFDDHLEGKFTKEEFIAGMKAMGFDDEEIVEFIRDEVESARLISDIIDEKGGIDGALNHFAANAKRSQLKVITAEDPEGKSHPLRFRPSRP
jgi:hypothetical protein